MTAPKFSLPVAGQDPRITSRESLELETQRCLNALDANIETSAVTLQTSIDGNRNDLDALETSLQSEIRAVANATNAVGNWSPSSGAFPTGAATGDYYFVDGDGTVGSLTFASGDWLIKTADGWAVGRYSQISDQADGRAFGSIAELVATTTVAQGQTVIVGGLLYEIVPAGSYTANGDSVVDLSGISGQAVLGPREDMADGEAVLADTRGPDWFEAGQSFRAGGNSYRSVPTGGMVLTTGGARFTLNSGGYVNVRDFGAKGDGSTHDTAAIMRAIETLANVGGDVIFPSGDYVIPASGASTDEGVAIVLEARHSNVTLIGQGRVKLIPTSNTVEILAQNGASNVRVQGIVFDNSPHGALQNQIKNLDFSAPGGGVAGQGNEANCAIRQYRGANLSVVDCEFEDWITAVHYIGNTDDDSAIVGDYRMRGCRFDGVAFGVLVDSPRTYSILDCVDVNGIDSIKSDGNRDPGHMVYGNNPLGAHPLSVTVVGNRAYGRLSSPVKVRKGMSVTITGNAFFECGRGMDVSNVYGASIDNNHVVLGLNETDTKSVGIVIIDGGPGVHIGGGNVVDVNGQDAFGVHIEAGVNTESWHNLGVTVGAMKVIDNVEGSQNRAAYRITDQRHCAIRGAEFFHLGTLQKSGFAVVVVNSTDVDINGFVYRAVNNPPGMARVIQMRTNSTGRVRLNSTDLAIGFETDVVDLQSGSTVDFAIDGIAEIVETGNEITTRYADGRQTSFVTDVLGTQNMTAGETLQGTYTFARPFRGTQALHNVSCTPLGTWSENKIAEAAEKLRASVSPGGTDDSVHWAIHATDAYDNARLSISVEGIWR